MDFYALQMTPRKKKKEDDRQERLKKIKEHVVTREEILSELNHEKSNPDFSDIKTDVDVDVDKVGILSPSFSSEKTFSISREDNEDAEIGNISRTSGEVMNFETSTKEQVDGIKVELNSEQVESEVAGPMKTEPIRTEKIESDILKKFTDAVLADDEGQIKNCIQQLIEYRAIDLSRINDRNELNEKLRKNLLETIPVLMAYKSSKSVLNLFQMLDEIGITFSGEDLSILPSEILESVEIKKIAEKYILWFAKEYSDSPAELEKRINIFADCGVLSYEEIKSFESFKMAISTNLVDFVRENVKDPLEVERKIYEYALTGLIDEKNIKGMKRFKQIIAQFILGLIKSKKEDPLLIGKKIKNYEKAGLIRTNDLIKDEKIEHIIEKFLIKYAKDNSSHPRKIKTLVREYYDAGLISRELKNKF